ncbi:hypothetical protein O4J56_01415 [Nocardiopsis sp. RSe5-2]|uniref:Uncharacterized protein n=1 Tax=Nocardiopsis endophytica TaxID=3018445 RepID=A0ABT4TX60_9ACTN|nr:DUF6653 family protein [Nocardiopsis endophytica]MDA2809283.1 hypothetical protein [Nocardiopsis endophytica]
MADHSSPDEDREGTGVIARARRAVFARHCNPWSAWTRWATTPLILVPLWTRNWKHAVAVGAWFAVNPVLFPEPEDDSDWATRAMLGEELWITERPKDAALAVQAVASAANTVAAVSAWRRKAVPAAAGTAVMMGLTMVYWAQMARYYEESKRAGQDGAPRASAG